MEIPSKKIKADDPRAVIQSAEIAAERLSKNDIQSTVERPQPWKILFVDDETEVHDAARLVLRDFRFAGRALEIKSCHSAREAREFLKKNNEDYALALIDVVMEEDDSGLLLVEYIRKELGNARIRIVLGTGLTGLAPERHDIVGFDITDYKSKTELTSEKLITTIVACLRSYVDLATIERNRRGIERIVVAADDIYHVQSFSGFVREVVIQSIAILGGGGRALFAGKRISTYHVYASSEGFGFVADIPVDDILSKRAMDVFEIASIECMSVFSGRLYAGYFRSLNGAENVLLIEREFPFDSIEKEFLEIYATNVANALENQYLNMELEMKVEQRTWELRQAKADVEQAMHELETINEKLTIANRELELAKQAAENDMKMAENVQKSIIIKNTPSSPYWDTACYFKPMSGVSGDFYDFHSDDKGDLCGACLFDVSGHGVASGLITLLSKSVIFRRSMEMREKPLGEVVGVINDDLIKELENVQNFLSGVIFRLYNDKVEYVNAGHPDIIVRSSKKGTYSLADEFGDKKGYYLGIAEMRSEFPTITIEMNSGDAICAYTDCLSESTNDNGESFGADRILRIIESSPKGVRAFQLIDRIMAEFNAFTGSKALPDDCTVIVLKKK